MLSKTKIFVILNFLPSWMASLLMWGDDRTSSGFELAPYWFYRAQLAIQFVAILILFIPLKIRYRPSLFMLFLSLLVMAALYFSHPVIEAEFVLISGSILISIMAIFLSFAQPNATFETSDIKLLFYLFAGGFLLQIVLFLWFDHMPSHSSTGVFIRFNGITNDSLSSGFIISLFIPWAVSTRFPLLKVMVIVAEAFASGSMFAVVFVPLMIFGLLLYRKLYHLAMTVLGCTMAGVAYFYDIISSILELKIESILIHLRFFLNLSGLNYLQSKSSCSEEFCESLVESGLHLSPVYVIAFYALMLCFVLPLFRSDRLKGSSPLIRDTLRIYGAALIVGSFVHPVPLIPFAVPLFLILASLYEGEMPRSTRLAPHQTRFLAS